MESIELLEGSFYENRRTPQSSSIPISDVVNAFSELHLLDSPKSRNYDVSTRPESNPHGPQSRLNTETKKRTLFPAGKQENLKWTDDEVYALVLFMMLYTDGKQWANHKDMKFWNDAGIFILQHSGSSQCRTGNVYHSAFVTMFKVFITRYIL